MRAVFALVLLVGVALAGVAVYMAQNFVGQSQAAVAKAQALQKTTGKLVQVYAVKKPLAFGAPLSEQDVHAVFVQEKYLPEGAYLVPKDEENTGTGKASGSKGSDTPAKATQGPLFPANESKPRYVMRSMEPNEIILASRVTEPGQVSGLAGKLDKGMRAFQIRVSTSSGVAGFVMPESLIDIYWTGAGGGGVSGEITRLIEGSVRVLAVDQSSEEGETLNGNAKTVTVAATPEQVARLAQAQATGRLAMSIVAENEDQVTALVEVDRDNILGIEKQEVVKVEVEKSCTVKQRKGGEVVETEIPCTN